MNGQHPNAVAGPSSLRPGHTSPPLATGVPMAATSSLPLSTSHPTPASNPNPISFPLLFLPPPVPPPPKQHLASTQDLLARLQLLPAYDKYVRNHGGDTANVEAAGLGSGSVSGTPGVVDKGKGKEVPGGDVDMADAMDGDDDDGMGGKGEKKKKNSYKHLIKGVPGKHSFKKDDYLATMMLVPPKQRMRIHRFDERTQEDAFTVSLEGLKGWNYNALVVESAQAREDRKKRKEAKRAAKLGYPLPGSTPSAGGSTPIAQPPPIQAPIPTSAQPTPAPRAFSSQSGGAATPKPGTPRPGSRAGNNGATGGAGTSGSVPRPTSAVPRPGSTVPRPGSAIPRPGSVVPKSGAQMQGQLGKQRPGTPVMASTGTPMDITPDQQRGKKREREENGLHGVVGINGVHHPAVNGGGGGGGPGVTNPYASGNGNGNANGISNGVPVQQRPPMVVNAKAGTGNIRPRPIKKQRMDVQGQARDVTAPVQQPTPQGV